MRGLNPTIHFELPDELGSLDLDSRNGPARAPGSCQFDSAKPAGSPTGRASSAASAALRVANLR